MRALVTGGAGFIGAPLASELLRRGHEVTVLDDLSVGSRERVPAGAALVEVDLRDAAAARTAARRARPEAVVHLAAAHFIPWCVEHPRETRERNVLGTRNLLAATPDVPLVFASTGDVYAPAEAPRREHDPLGPINVYGQTKLDGERMGEARGARLLRLFNVYGPGETNPHVLAEILRQLRDGDRLRLGDTSAVRDWVYLYDVVRAIAELLEMPGRGPVNVASGRACSVDELIDLIRSLTGRPLRVEPDPSRMRASDRPRLAADVSRLRELLPAIEPTAPREGLAATLEAEGLL